MMSRSIGAACISVALVALALPARATPVCAEEPRVVCGDRIFPEAERSVAFVQHDNGEYEAGIKALAKRYPRFVRITKLSEILGKKAVSFEGREIWLVEITDFKAPKRGKLPVVASLSVHGLERAGLEGGVRYMEDLARWATDDPAHELRNGTEKDSIAVSVGDALKRVHLYLSNINPDGWARGDLQNGGVYQRGNGRRVDLNREFPTMGWTRVAYTPLSEPESIAWDKLMRRIRPVVASDLHGEITSANNAFTDIMLPAGQWDPLEQAQEERLARHMASNVARYFEEHGVEIHRATAPAGMVPAEYATGYDVVGYDASGFMGDYLTQRFGAVEVDVEHFVSHIVPNSLWLAPLEEAHIMAVRAEIETLIVEALATGRVRRSLDLGRAGYLFDPAVVTSADGYGGPPPPKGVKPRPYRATPMQYFRDLSRFSVEPLRGVDPPALSTELDRLDSFVVSSLPKGGVGRAGIAALERFVKAGGNLVLTDEALELLPALGVVERDAIRRDLHNAGHIDIEDFDDPYTKRVHHTASQTYYEVPLGYSIEGDHSPHWTVDRAAWENAGGKSIAHVEDEDRIGLGRVGLGKGTVGIFGAVLPPPVEKWDHFFGLADYAVTIAGGDILNNMIPFGR